MIDEALPLSGIRVIEFTHMVMGPSVGLILADLGADVIKVEPKGGDQTRHLLGSGAGYFPMFNRNKRSICLDLKSEVGKAAAIALVEGADILIENFRPGTLVRLGLGPDDFAERHPRLIYCSAKGFLTGPYENRTALDEVTQMMGGLAYMTGPPGRPLRAGASVVDITGGMFGVIGILAALERRHRTGRGGDVKCALFETTAFLVGQHMAQEAVTGKAPRPMPDRISAWAIYDVFETRLPDEQVFVGVVSDGQWVAFCVAFGLDAFLADATLATNNQRVEARERILPTVRDCFRAMSRAEAVALLERLGLPFAPIATPSDLFDDRHLGAGGGLVDLTLEDGTNTRLPGLPIEVDGSRMPRRLGLPTPGEHGAELLREAGLSEDRIAAALA
ncbi:crotonobetainyl-CoA:carnitine CoA-transferase CaiB-like acyl-CoA transferase [Sphingomonas aurantiaca]|uniref:Crotonobetainyl-CoA:carnitine CoA-transferase CaiB-like acyl-CoA transferase n=1 Tax=Sphingomonas aurantiaca TaxID=185949 RepID=A0A2T5GGG6_9SPHN|nr:CoA transferase [Sphingomonas aurantiaca]PTQ58397.1 crotonobetainyl-CoA:carnitine CoA-transferase CaiB-like acyl-CoA transferase [Sphingomonas aurantiaca]